jgi:hypothetical protein
MECPRCRRVVSDGSLHCGYCGARLFAWLGDPFGNAEEQQVWLRAPSPGEVAGIAAPGEQERASGAATVSLWLKITLAGLVLLLFLGSLPLAVLLTVAALFWLFKRNPQAGWGSFFFALVLPLVVGGVLNSVWISMSAPGRPSVATYATPTRVATATVRPAALATPSRPAATAVPTRGPTATSIAGLDYLNRGRSYWLYHRYADAVAELNHAIALSPEWYSAYNLRALVRVADGKTDDALADAQRALDLTQGAGNTAGYKAVLDTRAYVLLRLDRCAEASADYDQVFGLGSPSAANYLGRGLAHACLRDGDKARPDLIKGLELAQSASTDPQLEDLSARAAAALKQLR